MSQNHWSNQTYLLSHQYNNAQKLGARINIHERFSINTYDWQRWVFDHFNMPAQGNVLEIGCGPGMLWLKNADRIPEQWNITLSDFSAGMLQEAQNNLRNIPHPFTFKIIDAQSIPFADQQFDMIVANHMLYHVPDRAKALAEIRRILKPGGHFFAATNGKHHMQECREIVISFDPSLAARWDNASPASLNGFRLESGDQELSAHFSNVILHIYEDGLMVTEAEPLVAYIISNPIGEALVGDRVEQFTQTIEQEIARSGAIRISKETGLFETF
jgi:SAM-dependent methyltransferase